MKIYFKHRKTNFRKKEQIHKFLFSLIKKKEEGLQVPGSGGGGWILPQWSGCASIRSTITTAARWCRRVHGGDVGNQQRSGQRQGRRVARMGSQETTLTARDRRPDQNADQSFVIEVTINVQH